MALKSVRLCSKNCVHLCWTGRLSALSWCQDEPIMNAISIPVSHLLHQLVCIDTARSTDCISHMDACVSPHVCKSEQAVLRNICHFKGIEFLFKLLWVQSILFLFNGIGPGLAGRIGLITVLTKNLQIECLPSWSIQADSVKALKIKTFHVEDNFSICHKMCEWGWSAHWFQGFGCTWSAI